MHPIALTNYGCSCSVYRRTTSVVACTLKTRTSKKKAETMSVAVLSGFIGGSQKAPSSRKGTPCRSLVDEEYFHACGDCGTMEHERELENRTPDGCFRIKDVREMRKPGFGQGVPEDEIPVEGSEDFRDHIDHVKCDCKGGKTCILCVTSKDLMAIPSHLILESTPLPDTGRVPQFRVVMNIPAAIDLGLISEDDLPEEPVEE